MGKSSTRTETSPRISERAVTLRHRLHRRPDLSGEEAETARTVAAFLEDHGLSPVREGLGGHGLLYRIGGDGHGPTLLLRADLDALPLVEASDVAHASEVPERHHACGHDGHMAMLAGALAALAEEALDATVYGLFQPAEESGEGGRRVIDDPRFPDVTFDGVYSLHNLPGHPLGDVIVRPGPMAVASVGLHYHFKGATSHAGAPHEGHNPIPAIAHLALRAIAVPAYAADFRRSALVTPIHLDAGRPTFGTSAGEGSLRLTARADDQELLDRIVARIDALAKALAESDGLTLESERVEPFPATVNDEAAAKQVEKAARAAGLEVRTPSQPMPWSEDFGHFTSTWPGALACLGAGDRPDLHTPSYDFPDELVPIGIRFWKALATTKEEPS